MRDSQRRLSLLLRDICAGGDRRLLRSNTDTHLGVHSAEIGQRLHSTSAAALDLLLQLLGHVDRCHRCGPLVLDLKRQHSSHGGGPARCQASALNCCTLALVGDGGLQTFWEVEFATEQHLCILELLHDFLVDSIQHHDHLGFLLLTTCDGKGVAACTID